MGMSRKVEPMSQEFHSNSNSNSNPPNPPRLMYRRGVLISSADPSYSYSSSTTSSRPTVTARVTSTLASTSTSTANNYTDQNSSGSLNIKSNSNNNSSGNNYNRRLSSVNDSPIKSIITNVNPLGANNNTDSTGLVITRQGSIRRNSVLSSTISTATSNTSANPNSNSNTNSNSNSTGGKKTVAFSSPTHVSVNNINRHTTTSTDTNYTASTSATSARRSSVITEGSQQHRRSSCTSTNSNSNSSTSCTTNTSRSEAISSRRNSSSKILQQHQSSPVSDQVHSSSVYSPQSGDNNHKHSSSLHSRNKIINTGNSAQCNKIVDEQANSSWTLSDQQEKQDELRLMAYLQNQQQTQQHSHQHQHQHQHQQYNNNTTNTNHNNNNNSMTNGVSHNNNSQHANNVNMNNNKHHPNQNSNPNPNPNQNHGRKEFVPSFVLVDAAKANNDKKIRELVRRLQPLCSEDVDPVVNFQDACGRTALSYAAGAGNYNMIDELSKLRKIDPNLGDNDKNAPLHYCSQAGHSDCVDLLITRFEGNIDLNCRNSTGLTPLMKSALQGRTRCVKSLITKGAQAYLRDYSRGYSAADWAKLTGRHICAEVILRCAKDNYQTNIDNSQTNFSRRPLPVSQSAIDLKRIENSEESPYYHLYAARNTISGATWLKNKIKKALGSSSTVNNSTSSTNGHHSSKNNSYVNGHSDNFTLLKNVTVPGLCASSLLLPSIKPLIEQQKPIHNQSRRDVRMTIPIVQVTHDKR